MSESKLKRFEYIRNILRDDWETIIESETFNCLEAVLDNKKLHTETTENIKKHTSHFFSDSEQARILNYKSKIGKQIYYGAYREVSKLKKTRDELKKEKIDLKIEISMLESDICLTEKIDVDVARLAQ